VIASQHRHASGVDGHTFGEPELGRKVGDARLSRRAVVFLIPGALALHIAVEPLSDPLQMGQEPVVLGCLLQPLLLDSSQHQYGVVAGLFPELAVQPTEEIYSLQVPAPPEVVGQVSEVFQLGRQRWDDGKSADGLHVSYLLYFDSPSASSGQGAVQV